jgi:hypothetical protein
MCGTDLRQHGSNSSSGGGSSSGSSDSSGGNGGGVNSGSSGGSEQRRQRAAAAAAAAAVAAAAAAAAAVVVCTVVASDSDGASKRRRLEDTELQAAAGQRSGAWIEARTGLARASRPSLGGGSGGRCSRRRRAPRFEAARRVPTGGGRTASQWVGRAGSGTRATRAARGDGGGGATCRFAAAAAARTRGSLDRCFVVGACCCGVGAHFPTPFPRPWECARHGEALLSWRAQIAFIYPWGFFTPKRWARTCGQPARLASFWGPRFPCCVAAATLRATSASCVARWHMHEPPPRWAPSRFWQVGSVPCNN